jgi:major membrane immunogen (membrane-anchored lipoprotein)
VPCAYDYGWNAGVASYADVVQAENVDGVASPNVAAITSPWWLDVETGNAWETKADSYGPSAASAANDAAMLEGEVAYLQSVHVSSIGFYSTSSMWQGITGGSVAALADLPVWIPGAGDIVQAQANCTLPSFTGGRVALIQYPSRGYDGDYVCGLLNNPITVPVTVSATATYSDQLEVANNDGAVTFAQSVGAPSLLVSASGLLTTSGQLAPGTYAASGTTADAHGNTGTFSITLVVGTIFQAPPITSYVKVPNVATYSEQLNVIGNVGVTSYVQASGAPELVVSATGLVTTNGTLAAGTYVAKGSVTDASSGLGTYIFTLTVGVITQNAPTSTSLVANVTSTYTKQLTVSRNDGPVSFVQTSGAPALVVSASGLITTSGALAAGAYTVRGTTSDQHGDKGRFVFTVNVTATPATTTTTLATSPPAVPTARLVKGYAVAGKTRVLTIVGANFFGQPIVLSHAGTTVVVTHDTGHSLTLRVRVRARSRRGVFVFTVTFANGQTCRVRYVQR